MAIKWFSSRGEILRTILAAVGVTLAVLKGWPDMIHNQFLSLGAFVMYTMLGLAITVIVRNRRSPSSSPVSPVAIASPLEGLVLRQLWVECDAFLSEYRRLDYDNRGEANKVRFPLLHSSWPNFGERWDYVSVELYAMAQHFALFRLRLSDLVEAMGYADCPSLPDDVGVVMVDLLAALDELLRYLKGKLNQRLPSGQ